MHIDWHIIGNIIIATLSFAIDHWAILIPILLFIYTYKMWKKGGEESITTYKRIFYSSCIALYILYVYVFGVSGWCKDGPFGIKGSTWSYFVSMIVTLLVAIVIDNFIISGYVFKEFGFFGAKFIRENAKKAIDLQNNYVLSLENSLKTLYDVPEVIHNLFTQEDVIKSLKDDTFDFNKEFTKILKYYYSKKNIDTEVDVTFYDSEDIPVKIEEYAAEYQMDKRERKELKGRLDLSNGTKWYINRPEYSVFIITIKLSNSKPLLLIKIKSFNETNLYDAYPIYNFLFLFQIEISYI